MIKRLWQRLLTPFRWLWRILTAPFRWLQHIRDFLNQPVEEHSFAEIMDNSFAAGEGVSFFSQIAPHIQDLRRHLQRMVVALMITVGISFFFTEPILNYLARPIGGLENLKAIEVTESIGVFMKVALMSGLALASPYLAFEAWHFLAPGLMPSTRKTSLIAIPLATLFLVGGMAFAFYVMMPAALPFLQNFMGIQAEWRPGSYYSFLTSVMVWIGLTFEFPLIIYLLSSLGWVTPQSLADQGRLAIVLIAILAAAITPTVDPVNMALVMGPMIVLYYFSILLSKLAYRERQKRLETQEEA